MYLEAIVLALLHRRGVFTGQSAVFSREMTSQGLACDCQGSSVRILVPRIWRNDTRIPLGGNEVDGE
jgi:hypothetical protein